MAVGRQLIAAGIVGVGLYLVRPWLGMIDETSLVGAVRLATVLLPSGLVYLGVVQILGGREIGLLRSTFKGDAKE